MVSELKIKQGVSVADPSYEWQPLDTCPRGSKVALMPLGGSAVWGVYTGKEHGILAWAPMPSTPGWLRDLLVQNAQSTGGKYG